MKGKTWYLKTKHDFKEANTEKAETTSVVSFLTTELTVGIGQTNMWISPIIRFLFEASFFSKQLAYVTTYYKLASA